MRLPRRARRRHRAAARVRPGDAMLLLLLAVPLGLLGSGALVWEASNAAFTASTQNAGNSWETGTVVLTDDDNGTARFTATNLKPGDTQERCIVVSNGGTLDPVVRLHAAVTGDENLRDHLVITIRSGTGGSFASCNSPTAFTGAQVFSGTLTALAATNSWENGIASWSPTAVGQTRTYRIGYTLSTGAPDTAQGKSAGATFTWEARS